MEEKAQMQEMPSRPDGRLHLDRTVGGHCHHRDPGGDAAARPVAAKMNARATACANNLRQLAVAWAMYSDDNGGLLVNNSGTVDTRAYRRSWVNNIEDWGMSPENTNPVFILTGKLAPYVANNLGVYKCPSDQAKAQDGPRLRSYSVNSLVGDPLIKPNRFNPNWVQFLRVTDFPGPANFWVFIEEHPDTINDGYFMNVWDQIKWGNLPASYHHSSANLSWADGHLERHRWIANTVRPARSRRRRRRLCPFPADRLSLAPPADQHPDELKSTQPVNQRQIMALTNAPDLTQRPPRSPRVRLGGYAILPRLLDKGRARSPARTANTSSPARSTSGFWNSPASIPRRSRSSLPPEKAMGRSLPGFGRMRRTNPPSPRSWPGPPSRTIERPPTPNHGSSSKARTPRSPPNATTSPLGSTCSTWTIT